MEIKIVNHSKHPLPSYATPGAAGMDIRTNIEAPILIKAWQSVRIPTGLAIELPPGFEMQIRPRSGLSMMHGITLINAPATIDSDYRGEILVSLINLSDKDFMIYDGDRIGQLVVARYEQVVWTPVTQLSETARGQGGYGSTGLK